MALMRRNIAGFYYINENSAMRQSLITSSSLFAYCVFFFNNPYRVSHLKKYHAHRLKVMQFFLLIPLNVKLTVFIIFMILLRWRKRLNTTGNWRLVNGTEQKE